MPGALPRSGIRRVARRSGRPAAILAALVLMLVALPATAVAQYSYPFRDPNLPLDTRITNLLSLLTTTEKISLLHQYEPAIPRLGIPAFKTGTEALHGVAWSTDINNNGAVVTADGTVFPQAVGLASTWDPNLIKQVGNAVGQEARGFNSENPSVWGLNLWGPVTNLLRDPRWGRNEEGYSEDPYLTGTIATAYGRGMEGDNPTYLQAAPTLKHYLAYNNEVDRDTSDSIVPPAILHDYDQQAFEPAIAANAATGVMASYNLVNGRPNTVDPDLATTERGWTGKTLMNVTDAGAPDNLTGSEHYYATQAEADAAAIKAGIDSFTSDDTDSSITVTAVLAALRQGLLTEADIDKAAGDVLAIRFRLGDFDPPGRNPYAAITSSVIDDAAHRALARQAADEQMVLLKNQHNALPLNPSATKKIAVVGPLENTLYTDWYSGNLPYAITPLAGITKRLGGNATVASSEGTDRIALRDNATGKYLTASTANGGATLTATGDAADADAQYDVFDWGDGVDTLRAVANNEYLSLGPNDTIANSATQPNGWYVQQQFTLDQQPDGSYVLEYAGYDVTESWFGGNKYAVVNPDGTVSLGASTPAAATHFTENLVAGGISSAVAAAKGADAAVVVVGSMPFINGREAHDRDTMALPASQEALVEAVEKANPHTIVVLENSYPDTIDWAQATVPAILHTTHAGQETGDALADVLFGDYDPSGRLTQTWYASDANLPSILDYDISKTDMTYEYYQGTPLYPFGYGLSYTTFAYHNLRLNSPAANADGTVVASVDVTNTGSRAGTDTVQLYSHERQSREKQPDEQLRGFAQVSLAPHQTRTVTITMPVRQLRFWDYTRHRYVVETGVYDLAIGDSATHTPLSTPLRVRGETIPPRDLTVTTPAQDFDDYSDGITLTDHSKAGGTSVESTVAGNRIEFADSALGSGVDGITASVADPGAPTSVQVRLDNPASGPVIGTLAIPSTGDHYSYVTVTAPLAKTTGTHTVYLVFGGPADLYTFRLTKS